jgi:uncharacterized 2Fe-2S/4Fe-4S cluster protein (DUF4445 family)
LNSDRVRLTLQPLGQTVEVERGSPLKDVLFGFGVEFPCGGKGRCRGCRIKVLDHGLRPRSEELGILSEREIEEGWRLACRAFADSDCTLEVAQWESAILADQSQFAFVPREGQGVAVDLGTTTLVAQLLDLRTANVLAVRTALNPQAAHGADIMSRVQFAMHSGALTPLIRERISALITELAGTDVRDIVIVGNTVMHHLFSGLDLEALSHVPFETSHCGPETVMLEGHGPARFLPNLGSFVGSDILAGILATGLHERDEPTMLIDLGTNGEMVIGNRNRILCASTAAGPAFEGGKISMGMRAATGAIAEVSIENGALRCSVLGGGPARGLCGSGLVDAVAAALDLDLIRPTGRLSNGPVALAGPVSVTQADVRELQLAKAAIAAGIEILVRRWGTKLQDISQVFLAGAFGNYINRTSARRIGLLPFPEEIVRPSGNTALLGAKLALFENDSDFEALRSRVEHVPLASDPEFLDHFVTSMTFEDAKGL